MHLEYDTETRKLNWHKSVVSRYKEQNRRFLRATAVL